MTVRRSAFATALAVAVDATLHLPDACLDGGEGVGDGETDVVVAVDAESHVGDALLDGLDGARGGSGVVMPPLVSHRTRASAPARAAVARHWRE